MLVKILRHAVLAGVVFSCGGETGDGVGGTGGASGSGGTGGSGDFSSCTASSECMVAPASCCGSCGAATRSDSIGLNTARVADYRDANCQSDGCPACYMAPDPALVPSCSGGTCVVVDLQAHPSTACGGDADCQVRTAACCECGGDTSPGTLVAVSDTGLYTSTVCDPDQACGECAPVYPPEVTARCTNGSCAADDPRLP